MQTLTQYQYLDRDMIMKGVANWIVEESPMLKGLPMKSIQGNSYKYNVSLTLPTAAWTSVGQQIAEGTGTYEQRSTSIYTLIANQYTDKSQIALNATQDPEAIDAELGAQAMAHEFEKTLIIGQTSVDSDAKQFKGLLRILAELEAATATDLDGINNSQVIPAHATSAALTQALMDELLDQIKPGKADLLLMSRRARRKLNVLARTSGSSGLMVTDAAKFGVKMEHYDGVPVFVSDWILDNYYNNASSVLDISAYDFNTTRTTDYDNTVIFAMQLGEDKVTGLHAGEMKHERGDAKTPDPDYNAILNRYIWYVGLACIKKYSLAALTGVNPDS